MKVSKEAIKAEGLTTLYESDNPTEIGLDIIFVHGLGGHSVRTWLHTTTTTKASAKNSSTPPSIVQPPNAKPSRSRYLVGDLAAPSENRSINTLKKRHSDGYHWPCLSDKFKLPPRPQTADEGTYKAGTHEAPSTSTQLAPKRAHSSSILATKALRTVRNTITEDFEQPELAGKETYWPLELLPKSCPTARIFTYGFQTHVFQGKLSADQPDIFARGRELLEAVTELRRNSEVGRKMVFVAHSTGGIIVKEMLRLASEVADADDNGLLTSVASVIFMGCPLKNSNYGSLVIAMKSMAAATVGVAVNDVVLGKMLGENRATHLTSLGRDAFKAMRKKYKFRVKAYRESVIEPPLQPWAEMGLALRRDASTLDDTQDKDEDIPGGHTSMCKFASRRDEGYQLVSSYINKLAHDQALKRPHLLKRNIETQQSLEDSGVSDVGSRELSASPSNARKCPHWLLQHPNLQKWLHCNRQEDTNKLLWLTGLPGVSKSDLLSSLQAQIVQHWASQPHSSGLITITADQETPRVESVLLNNSNDIKDSNGGDKDHENEIDDVHEKPTSRVQSSQASTHETAQVIPPAISNTPARTLRSLLSQLFAHDPRLRNLVRRRSATAGTLHDDDELELSVETLFPSSDVARHTSQHHISNKHSTVRRSSDPTDSTTNLPFSAQTEALERAQGVSAKLLDHADVGALLSENNICLGPPERNRQQYLSDIERSGNGDADDDEDYKIEVSSLGRVFILVDAARVASNKYLGGLLWCLSQLSQRREFSVCIASTATMPNLPQRSASGRTAKSPSDSTLLIQMPEEIAEEIRQYLDTHLAPDMEEREAIAAKMLDRAAGVLLWAEMVTVIVNEASEEGVSGEIVLSMLDDMAPRRNGGGVLDGLYSWKLRRLGSVEQAQALVVMQWVMLAPEPLRLNELLVALRLTLLATRRGENNKNSKTADGKLWDIRKTLEVEPAMSLKELRAADSNDDRGIGTAMDSPTQFWKWLQQLSQGLLRLESAEGSIDSAISREPLGLQRVRPTDDSVKRFFLKGTGFQTLLAASLSRDDPQTTPLPSTDRFVDTTYYTLLHVCLLYLNMTELDALGREKPPLNPAPGSALPPVETSKWRAHADAQRRMVMASYPFLRYAVDHLVFHLLCPRGYRYFLPQGPLLALLSANRCRIWRRWTHLLGFSIADASPEAVLARVGDGPAGRLLDPVYGARYRLERVLRRVWRLAVEQLGQGSGGGGVTPKLATPRKGHSRARSDVSEGSVVFMLMGGEDPLKASWMVPASHGRGRGGVDEEGRALEGIQETGVGG